MGTFSFHWDRPDIFDQVVQALDRQALAVSRVPDRAVRRGAALLVRMVRSKIQIKGLMRSRNLLRAVMMEIEAINRRITRARVGVDVGRARYGLYLELGTGIYGPLKEPIRPKNGEWLHFRTPDGSWIKTRSVKGVPPQRFFGEAVEEFIPHYFRIIEQELDNELRAGGART